MSDLTGRTRTNSSTIINVNIAGTGSVTRPYRADLLDLQWHLDLRRIRLNVPLEVWNIDGLPDRARHVARDMLSLGERREMILHPALATRQLEEMVKRRWTSATANLGLKPQPGSAAGRNGCSRRPFFGGRLAARLPPPDKAGPAGMKARWTTQLQRS